MTDIYLASDDIVKRVRKLVGDHHPDLVLILDEIAVLFRDKASKKGGRVVLGSSKKAPKILEVLGDTNWKFIIELAADEWQDLTRLQQEALLDHHLCALRADEDPDTGEVKYYVAPPDIGYYYDELSRRGNWRPVLDAESTVPVTPLEEFIKEHNEEETDSEEEKEEEEPSEEESEEESG